MPLSASELHRRGVEATNTRRFAAARRALSSASARTDDPDLLARIDGTLAYVLGQTGRPAEAEQLSREALGRTGLTDATVRVLSGQLGTLLMHAGRLGEAEVLLTRAIDGMAEATSELANLLMNRSMVRMQEHRLDACVADLERAVAVYDANGDPPARAEAQHNLGYAALLGGDLVTALALMTAARPTIAETGDLAAAISDQDRAEVLRDAGMVAEAEELLAGVATLFGSQRMRQARGEAEFHLARSLLRHDAARAERIAATAQHRFTALGSTGWAARAEAVRLEARTRARPSRNPDAGTFARVVAALEQAGFRTDAAALAFTARRAHGGRLPRLGPGAPTPLRLRAQEVRAAQANDAGRHAEARRYAAAGLDLLTDWRRSFGALDLQASVGMHGTELVFAGLTAAARSGDPAVLFEWSERARHLSQQVTPVRPPHDAALAADLAHLRMLRADLAGSDWTNDPGVRALRDRVRERQWSTTTSGGSRDRIGLAETAARLDADTAVLAYVHTGTELQCVVVTDTGARIVALSWPRVRAAMNGIRADLDVAATTYGGPMGALVAQSLDARLRVLGDELVRPAQAAAPRASRLVITAPGVLAGIPWAMLPLMHGVPFALATSVSRWLETRPSDTAPARVGFAGGPRVPRAVEEITRSAEAWTNAEILSGERADVDAVTALAGRSDLLHIAAHGRHSSDNPMFAGFELSDGTLFGYDIDLITAAPETVILSACELGRSAVRWGEEALGMTRVWLHAGTRCVIAAPALVADDVAAELLTAVHSALAAGSAPAAALAEASVSTGLPSPFQVHGSGF